MYRETVMIFYVLRNYRKICYWQKTVIRKQPCSNIITYVNNYTRYIISSKSESKKVRIRMEYMHTYVSNINTFVLIHVRTLKEMDMLIKYYGQKRNSSFVSNSTISYGTGTGTCTILGISRKFVLPLMYRYRNIKKRQITSTRKLSFLYYVITCYDNSRRILFRSNHNTRT